MTDGWQWQPAGDEAPHTFPEETAILAAPRQGALPEPSDAEAKDLQRRRVHGHPIVADVSTHHRLQPLALFGNGSITSNKSA